MGCREGKRATASPLLTARPPLLAVAGTAPQSVGREWAARQRLPGGAGPRFHYGFHSAPSLRQLHMHVISEVRWACCALCMLCAGPAGPACDLRDALGVLRLRSRCRAPCGLHYVLDRLDRRTGTKLQPRRARAQVLVHYNVRAERSASLPGRYSSRPCRCPRCCPAQDLVSEHLKNKKHFLSFVPRFFMLAEDVRQELQVGQLLACQ